jgi:hypothetical protein
MTPFAFLMPTVILLGKRYVPSIESKFDQLTLTSQITRTKMI